MIRFVSSAPSCNVVAVEESDSPVARGVFFGHSASEVLRASQDLLPVRFPVSIRVPYNCILSSPFCTHCG